MDTLSLTKEARIYSGEKVQSLLTSGTGKTGQPLVKKNKTKHETRALSNTVHKHKLKME